MFHPKTAYVNGRPEWVFTHGRRPVFVNDTINVSCPCLILAYRAEEDILKAVPVDVVELENKDDRRALALKKGRYRILIKNKEEKQQMFPLIQD